MRQKGSKASDLSRSRPLHDGSSGRGMQKVYAQYGRDVLHLVCVVVVALLERGGEERGIFWFAWRP
jgi:hypothetical protein